MGFKPRGKTRQQLRAEVDALHADLRRTTHARLALPERLDPEAVAWEFVRATMLRMGARNISALAIDLNTSTVTVRLHSPRRTLTLNAEGRTDGPKAKSKT